MKVTGKKSLSTLIEIWYIDIFNPILNYTAALIILYASGIPALIIVYKFIKIFKTLRLDNPFTLENVRHLNVISICSLIIAIEYAIGIFFIVSIFEVILIAVCCIYHNMARSIYFS